MAIMNTLITKHGITVNNAYHRVEGVYLKSKNEIGFSLRSYADTKKPNFLDKQYSCKYVLEGDNPIKQAYEYLKTLSEFSNAKDV